ncbi:MAG TPA: SDR family oxidoreductase [Candidatus Hydrogenedentes bacterium]|nr:SDR family oxidoreductase [Candidatus Hydrogenedentota bacterium]HPG69501.1 SDR family oxidoreductase [Candidatus Hydrogenedentota bacterium]
MGVLDLFSLEGKVALVTGGAGLYGRQILQAVAEAGAETYVASRNLDALEVVAATHRAQGLKVTAMQYDQGEEPSIRALRDAILDRSGRVDVLVNNAVARPLQNGFQSDIAQFAESMRINATGLFAITRAFGDVMAAQRTGSIINIGSIMGVIGPDPTNYIGTSMHAWAPDYFFHKGGMINLTRFIASYYGGNGVRCNCLSLGGYETEAQAEVFKRNYANRTFLGRLANDTDVMGAVVFLASDASVYITGENIMVDGGYVQK